MTSFETYPAIDVRGGRVVRLRQGDYARETRHGDDPYARAMACADAGARWLHLVDLDGARAGGYTLRPLLARIARDGRLRVQTGGGVRTDADVEALFEAGASRVVVGSLAVEQPDRVAAWLAHHGAERLVLALDVRADGAGWRPATHGWTRDGGAPSLADLLARYREPAPLHVLCTDIACDGMLGGPNLALYDHVRRLAPGVALQASGGIRDREDLARLRGLGCAGAVVGRAWLEGGLALPEALAC
jgi:phosphoribosylformimino-5-aminoimidazole carboxamide ribotide isomerase